MCGIAGFSTEKGLDRDTALRLSRAFLYYSEARGSHSAGCWVDGRLAKRAMDPHKFLGVDEFTGLFQDVNKMALLHTRMPTSGGREDRHAQPFAMNTTATVHNGHFSNCDSLKKKFEIVKPADVDVDSSLAVSLVDALGPLRLPDFLDAMSGSAAIAVVHDGELYLARTSNPLYTQTMVLPDHGGTLFAFASTQDILLNSLRSCWLLASDVRPSMLEQNQMYRVRENSLKSYGRYFGYKSSYQGRGTHGCYGFAGNGNEHGNGYPKNGHGGKDPKASDGEWPSIEEVTKMNHAEFNAYCAKRYGTHADPKKSTTYEPGLGLGHWEDLGNGAKVWRRPNDKSN